MNNKNSFLKEKYQNGNFNPFCFLVEIRDCIIQERAALWKLGIEFSQVLS